MSVIKIINDATIKFNDRQRATGRRELENLEIRMLVLFLEAALAEEMGNIRDELESVASKTDVAADLELDWATDIIVATMRMDNKLSVSLFDEEIRKYAAGFILKIDRDEGVTELELIVDNDDN